MPVITAPRLSPSIIYKNTTIYCNTTITDEDDESGLTVEFSFYNWTQSIYNTTNSSVLNNTVVWAILPSQYFNKSANLSCRARGYDGTTYTNWSESPDNITVLNTPPVWNPDPRTVSANSTAGSEYFLHCSDDDPEDVMFYSINDTLAGKLSLARLTGNLSWAVFNETEAYTYGMNYSCSDDQINVSYYGFYQINDTTMPFPFREENSSNPVYRLSNMSFNISFTDWKGGDTAVFYFDDGVGSFSNYSIFSWRGEINRNFSVNRTINALTAMTVRWYWWANDTSNNSNTTVEHSFVVPNRKPSNATIADIVFAEDQNHTLNLSLFFNDTDGERLTYSVNLSSTDSSHNVNYTFWEIGDNVTLIPAPDYYGSEWVIFQAKDNANDTNQSNRIAIDILSVPDPPRFVSVTFNPAGPTDMSVFAIMVNVTSETGVAGLMNCTTNSTISQLDGLAGSAAAGGNRKITFFTNNVPEGNDYFTITCADANGLSSYTSNITVSAEPTDLAISSSSDLSISPSNPASDAQFAVSLKVRNTGVHNASNINVSFYKDGVYAGSTRIPFIDSGMNRTSSPILLSFSTTGLHVLKAVIDPDNEIPELNKANNQVSKSMKVGQSNLTYFINVTGLRASRIYYHTDPRILTDDVFRVEGSEISYYPPFETTRVQGGAVTVTVNGVNYTGFTDSEGDFEITGMSIPTAGTYQVITNVTDGNVYGDNTTLTVTIYARETARCVYPDYLPDLSLSTYATYVLNDTTPVQNISFQLSPVIVNYYCGNNGTAPGNFSRSFNVSFYMDSTYLGKQVVYQNLTYATSVQVPQALLTSAYGFHTVWGVIDVDNEIPESVETNNAFNFTIYVYPLNPELRVTDFFATQAPFSVNTSLMMVFANRPVNFTAQVENWGGTATRYNLSLSEYGTYLTSELKNISEIGTAGYVTRVLNLSSTFGASAAARNVTALANSTDHPDDPEPQNNHDNALFYSYERPDVWVKSFSMYPDAGSPGSERISPVGLNINFTIENFGVIPTPAPFNITIEDMYDDSRPVFTYRFNDSIGANFSTAQVTLNLTGFTNGTHKIRVRLDSNGELTEIYSDIGSEAVRQNTYGYNTYIPATFYVYPSAPVVQASYTYHDPYTAMMHSAVSLTLYSINIGAFSASETNVSATARLPDGTVESIHDYSIASMPAFNGNHTEIFSFTPRMPGNHLFSGLVNSSGSPFYINNHTVYVMHPDMRVIADNIVFSADTVMLNQSINTTIAISNQDVYPAYNVTVNVSVNGHQVNQTIIPVIYAGSTDFMTTNFTVNQTGFQVVLASVNELWKSFEADEDDNTATKATLFAYNISAPGITFNEFSSSYLSGTKLFKANVTDFDNDTSIFDVYFHWVNLTDSSKTYMFHSASALSGNVKVPPGAYFGENYSTLLIPDGQYRFSANTTDYNQSAESLSRVYVVDNTPPAVNFDPQALPIMKEITEILYNATDLYPYETKWRYSSDGGSTWSSYSTVYYRPVNGSSYDGTNRNITFNPDVCGTQTEPRCMVEMYMQDMAGNYNTASISFRTKEAETTVVIPPDPESPHDFGGSGRGACAPGYFNFTVSSSHNFIGTAAKLYMHDGTGRITSDGLIATDTVRSDGKVSFYIQEPGHYIVQLSRPGFNTYHYTFALDACIIQGGENGTAVVTPPAEETPEEGPAEERPPAPPLVPEPFVPSEMEPEKPIILPDVGMLPALITGAARAFPWLLLLMLALFLVTYSYWLRKYRSLNLGEFFRKENLRDYAKWVLTFGGSAPPPEADTLELPEQQ